MDLIFAMMLLLPIILFISVCFLIFYWLKNRQLRTKISLYTVSIIVIMILILIWYYYPTRGILNNALPETVTINIDDLHVELTDKQKISTLLETINQNSYTRNASDSLLDVTFPSENLIRIDLYYIEEGHYTKRVHLYVLIYFENEEAQRLDELSKENLMQINEQFYRIKEPKKLSEDIYRLVVAFGLFDDLNK